LVREGVSFWVERRTVTAWATTKQALADGCFSRTFAYDATGTRWPILDATFARDLSLLDQVLPWRLVPVAVSFGQPIPQSQEAIADCVIKTLDFDGHEYSPLVEDQIRRCARSASSPRELIEKLAGFDG
jgi:hypothetical protein